MHAIDQLEFQFSRGLGLAVAVMVGFLVFSVALDLTREQFRRVLRRPVAPGIGLIAQFLILPAVAYGVGRVMAETPSIAIGLILVTCCPGGALSNYLTGVARGDVATSIGMTAVSTLTAVVMTPALFALWVSLNPSTAPALESIAMDPKRLVVMLLLMLVVPVTLGVWMREQRPHLADRIRTHVGRAAMVAFAAMVVLVLGSNLRLIVDHSAVALPPVLVTFVSASALGWVLARVARLVPRERRAVVFEVALQNVALAIGLSIAFFPELAGVAITCALWGVVHVVLGCALALVLRRLPATRQAQVVALPRLEGSSPS
jgi:bile acid:Na+ symporter, BASS family